MALALRATRSRSAKSLRDFVELSGPVRALRTRKNKKGLKTGPIYFWRRG